MITMKTINNPEYVVKLIIANYLNIQRQPLKAKW